MLKINNKKKKKTKRKIIIDSRRVFSDMYALITIKKTEKTIKAESFIGCVIKTK